MPPSPQGKGLVPLTASTPVIACGALVRELRALGVQASYLPAPLHSRPAKIPDAVEQAVRTIVDEAERSGSSIDRIVLGYGDCGTGGLLDARMQQLQDELQVPLERLAGDHCYSFFLGEDVFRTLHDEELGTFFLTDFLARHFEQLVWGPLKIGEHPELRDMYFGNYKRVVYLSQTSDPEQLEHLTGLAQEAANRLGLSFQTREGGLNPFAEALRSTINPSQVSLIEPNGAHRSCDSPGSKVLDPASMVTPVTIDSVSLRDTLKQTQSGARPLRTESE